MRQRGDLSGAESASSAFWTSCLDWGDDPENFCPKHFLRAGREITRVMKDLGDAADGARREIDRALSAYRERAFRRAERVVDARLSLGLATADGAAPSRLDEWRTTVGDAELALAENERGAIDECWTILGALVRGSVNRPVIDVDGRRRSAWRPVTPHSEQPLFQPIA